MSRGRSTEINAAVRQFTTDRDNKTIVYDNTGDSDGAMRPASKPYREKDMVYFNMRDHGHVDDANVLFLKLSLEAARNLRDDLIEVDLAPRCSKCGKSE